MKNYTIKIIALSMCLFSLHLYGMEVELPGISEETSLINNNKKDTADLETQIKKRKICNVLHGAILLATMAGDIANSYWDEKGLFKQTTEWGPCECPDQALHCNWQNRDSCWITSSSMALYAVNDGLTAYRLYSGFINLYHLYQTQQALNKQSIGMTHRIYKFSIGDMSVGKKEEYVCDEEERSFHWCIAQGCNSGIIGIIAVIVAIVNGIKEYPRTVAIWGVNSLVDALGACNWYKNKNTCTEVRAQSEPNAKVKTSVISRQLKLSLA